jgi:hypothetical protein
MLCNLHFKQTVLQPEGLGKVPVATTAAAWCSRHTPKHMAKAQMQETNEITER